MISVRNLIFNFSDSCWILFPLICFGSTFSEKNLEFSKVIQNTKDKGNIVGNGSERQKSECQNSKSCSKISKGSEC